MHITPGHAIAKPYATAWWHIHLGEEYLGQTLAGTATTMQTFIRIPEIARAHAPIAFLSERCAAEGVAVEAFLC